MRWAAAAAGVLVEDGYAMELEMRWCLYRCSRDAAVRLPMACDEIPRVRLAARPVRSSCATGCRGRGAPAFVTEPSISLSRYPVDTDTVPPSSAEAGHRYRPLAIPFRYVVRRLGTASDPFFACYFMFSHLECGSRPTTRRSRRSLLC